MIFPDKPAAVKAKMSIFADGGAMLGAIPCSGSNPRGTRMFAVQPRLPLARPRVRSVRRTFTPQQGRGSYSLPHDVRDRLASSLAPFRNREAAYALAVFLARFWSAPGRIVEAFHIDRRALADHGELHLTEARVRGAIRTLEEIGFLDRAIPPSGSKYKATEEGLHRKPIRFVFGSDYAPLFIAANERATRAHGAHSGKRRPLTPSCSQRSSVALPVARFTNSPKSNSVADPLVNLGDLRKKERSGIPPKASEPNPALESALERLRQGVFGKAEGGCGEGGARF
jgi:hypothetical protein